MRNLTKLFGETQFIVLKRQQCFSAGNIAPQIFFIARGAYLTSCMNETIPQLSVVLSFVPFGGVTRK